jgi:hypothetical protein
MILAVRGNAHCIVCNYPSGPLGGPGCVCRIYNYNEVDQMSARIAEAEWIIRNGDAQNGRGYESIQEWHRRALAWLGLKEWP